MVKRPFWPAVFLILAWPKAGLAEYKTVNDLLVVCKAAITAMASGAVLSSQELTDAGQCVGYLQAVADLSWAAGDPTELSVCLPPEISTAQLVRGVLAYTRRTPMHRNAPAFTVVFGALEEAFPLRRIDHPAGALEGPATDVDIHAREILHTRKRLNEILAEHTGQPLERIEADTERDRFMSGEEAVVYGLVDEVLEQRESLPGDEPSHQQSDRGRGFRRASRARTRKSGEPPRSA